ITDGALCGMPRTVKAPRRVTRASSSTKSLARRSGRSRNCSRSTTTRGDFLPNVDDLKIQHLVLYRAAHRDGLPSAGCGSRPVARAQRPGPVGLARLIAHTRNPHREKLSGIDASTRGTLLGENCEW